MSSRKEQKEQLRQERLERERAAAAAAGRRRRLQIGGGAGLLAIIVAVVIAVVVSSSGSSSNSNSGSSGTNASAPQSGQTVGDTSGLQTTTAPWKPEYSFLAQRLSAFNFPQQSDVGFHIHAELFVYVNGKHVTVPANVGIDPQGRFISPIHTHDTTGIVHEESEKPYPFTLGEFINVWGVYFTKNQLGAYKAGNGNVLQLWVNGKQDTNPLNHVMKAHDVMILGYGKPGSFPHKKSFQFPQGL
ncbi:MAG TPA: hypothetical protein VFL87_03105 [Thermoleophilaceae bacterium]|nr:hypothetical protein [Thermoleophilaceae bacterium]